MAGRCIDDSWSESHLNVSLPDGGVLSNKLLNPIKSVQNLQISSKNNTITFESDSFKDLTKLETLDVTEAMFDNNELKDASNVLSASSSFKEIRISSTFSGCSCSYYSLIAKFRSLGTNIREKGTNDCFSTDKNGSIANYFCRMIVEEGKLQRFIYFLLTICLLGLSISTVFATSGLRSVLSAPYSYTERINSEENSLRQLESEQKELMILKEIIDPCNRTNEAIRTLRARLKQQEKNADFTAESPVDLTPSNREKIVEYEHQKEAPLAYTRTVNQENLYNVVSNDGIVVAVPEGCKQKFCIKSPSVNVELGPSGCGGTEFRVSKLTKPSNKALKNEKEIETLQTKRIRTSKARKSRRIRKKKINRQSVSFNDKGEHWAEFDRQGTSSQFASRGQLSQKLYGVMKRMSEEDELNSSKNNYYLPEHMDASFDQDQRWQRG
ncbi:unnamed protein product [Dimorphilus gyrociliatus]|uniref:Uncharacterized protein n=1 Tax=Dimorphilus gyrociliatus TaxID=2664684 RepID=A0A7I8V6M9_9ANNE|nr:unnamed protein product [Dimorphilus gyrociliatus]